MNQAMLQTLAQVAGGATAIAINSLWEGALLVVCIWLLLRAWPGINASTRYIVWSATLIATVVVPIATTLPFLAPSSPSAVSAAAVRVPIPMVTHALTAAPMVRNTRPAPAAAPATTSSVPRLPDRFRVTLPLPVVLGVLAVWLLLTVVALARLGVGLFRLEQLKRDALPLPVEYRDAMARWTDARKGRRDVRLCVSDDIDVPVAVGLFDAMILIPRTLLERLSENEVDQISLHELAHLRRADDWSNGLQRLAVAIFGWNPAVQFVSQQLDLEREVACDDWVLASTGSVRPYAVCLTKMAETSSWPHRPMPAPGVFATRKHISLRIERLLGAGRNAATSLSLGPAAVTVAIVGALAFAMQLVAPSVAASMQPTTEAQSRKHVTILSDDTNRPWTALANARSARPSTTALRASAQDDMSKASAQPAKPKEIIKYVQVLATISSPQPAATGQLPSKAHVHVPATNIDIPPTKIDIPATHVDIPPIDVDVPAIAKSATNAGIATATTAASAAAGSASAYARSASQTARESTRYALTTAHAVAHSLRVTDNGSIHSCNDCNMSGANWAGRDMRNVNFTGSDLSHSNFSGTNFSGGTFNGVDFTGSNLSGASFRGARLTGCDFSKANLSGADFTGAILSGCQFSGTVFTPADARSVLDTCTGCDFSNANLAGDDLSHIHVKSVDFSGANLNGANLSNSLFTGVDFGNARMNGANLTNSVFNGCDLDGVDLTHVDLSRTKFIGTDFSGRGTPKP